MLDYGRCKPFTPRPSTPPSYSGVSEQRGTIAVGKRADTLVLDADRRIDIHNIRRINYIIAGGRLFSKGGIDRMIAARRRSAVRQYTFSTEQPYTAEFWGSSRPTSGRGQRGAGRPVWARR